ncbi:RNA methyltransferase (TrmH family protein, group 3) [Desulfamplus magnetovallimortis]|uniref:RNA methyltransferase (TrmH family protein, group 3) n=1 Tax=Desulfamplus magnetovallimortis TaxID=1246637 RepID=A0A1W1HCF7_9BACT|nr:23S rRNA (guanosine(2251)-2'-O)-methyltransferase RlmB [Desulfamplus magnetovallimortis]SLM30123.1 RNA methyltransferase (TrmH family protein, group 3) [Desulfamplus magnetovallimortis]
MTYKKRVKEKSMGRLNCEILCGIHPVLEAVKAERRLFFKIFVSRQHSGRIIEIVDFAKNHDIAVEYTSDEQLEEICLGVKHQGVAAEVGRYPLGKASDIFKGKINKTHTAGYGSEEEEILESSKKFFVILEGLQDPHNLGAIIRTAICAGADHIVLPKDRSVHPSPAVSRASAGAMEHADISIVTNIAMFVRELKKNGVWIAGLDAGGAISIFDADFSGDIALVVGGEHTGIRPLVKKECDFIVSLPMVKGVTSLNASVASGIAMYEILRQRIFK